MLYKYASERITSMITDGLSMEFELEAMLRIFLAGVCGGLIGLERSRRQKEAGIRTHIVVCMGAALMMVVSKYGFFDVISYDGISLDASRIASNIITGVSFLGAGSIFIRSDSIRGLTTAAGVWATSGVGLAIGSGLYIIAVFSTAMIIVTQILLHHFTVSYDAMSCGSITLILKGEKPALSEIRKEMEKYDILIQGMSVKKNASDELAVNLSIRMGRKSTLDELLTIISENYNVKKFTVQM